MVETVNGPGVCPAARSPNWLFTTSSRPRAMAAVVGSSNDWSVVG